MNEKMQMSFTGGEQSGAMAGRVDLSKYASSGKSFLNTIIHPHGGWSNRAGTYYVDQSYGLCRLIGFTYSVLQSYALEFSGGRMRIYKNRSLVQNPIVDDTRYKWVASTSGTAEYYLDLLAGGDPELIEPTVIYEGGTKSASGTVGALAAGEWSYADNDTLGYSTVYVRLTDDTDPDTKAEGYLLTPAVILSPYAEADLDLIKFSQSADIMFLVHPSYSRRTLTRTDHHIWTFGEMASVPSIEAPTNLAVVSVGSWTTGNISLKYIVTANTLTAEESLSSAEVVKTWNGTWVADSILRVTWDPVTDADSYTVYKSENGYFGWVGTVQDTQFEDRNISPNESDGTRYTRTPFEDVDDYPGAVGMFQQRTIFGRTNNNPQTVWTSNSGAPFNMSVASPLKDSDAITARIDSGQINEILHFVAMRDLIVFTSGAQWLMTNGGTSEGLTPTSASFDVQGYEGCSSTIAPIVIGKSVLFVERDGRTIQDMFYTLEDDAYTGSVLNILASHLFEDRTIVAWAYQKNPYSIIWCVMDDGTLLSLTYLREHEVWAWAHHETDGLFRSVCCIPGATYDDVYFSVERVVDGSIVYYTEYLNDRMLDGYVENAFFVDSGFTYYDPKTITNITKATPPVVTAAGHGFSNGDMVDMRYVQGMTEVNNKRYKVANATTDTFELSNQYNGTDEVGTGFTTYTTGGTAAKTITSLSGLDHLEGKEIVALANGGVTPTMTVTGGSVTLAEQASIIQGGLPYISEFESLNLEVTAEGALQGKLKSIANVTVRVRNTRGIWLGRDRDNMTEVPWRSTEDWGEPTALFTGDKEAYSYGEWDAGGRLIIQQKDPLPITVLAIKPAFEVEDV